MIPYNSVSFFYKPINDQFKDNIKEYIFLEIDIL